MKSDKHISYMNFVMLPNSYAEELIDITVDFMVGLMETRDVAMFQSAFGFMNNDVPFTMIIIRKSNSPLKFDIIMENNDWGIFSIEDDVGFWPSSEWKLKTESDRMNVPTWEEMNALEIYNDLGYHLFYERTSFADENDYTNLKSTIKELLMNEYVVDMKPEDWPCDILEAHVAMIYDKKSKEEEK